MLKPSVILLGSIFGVGFHVMNKALYVSYFIPPQTTYFHTVKGYHFRTGSFLTYPLDTLGKQW